MKNLFFFSLSSLRLCVCPERSRYPHPKPFFSLKIYLITSMQERILVSLFVFGFLYNFISFPVFPLPSRHGYDIRGYYDKGNFCRPFRLLSFNRRVGMWSLIILASWKDCFIRVGENMAQHQSNYIPIHR